MASNRMIGLLAHALIVGCAALALAQPSSVSIHNAAVETLPAGGDLATVFAGVLAHQRGPAWIGYSVPMRPGCFICCDTRGPGCRCRLERAENTYQQTVSDDPVDGSVKRQLVVLFRVVDGDVMRICGYSSDCELDGGGMPLVWFNDVNPGQSVDWLATFVTAPSARSDRGDDLRDRALSVIAFHDDPAALAALSRFLDPSQPEKLREQAVFWVGETGGRAGVEVIERVLRDDPSRKVREQAIFALTLCDAPAAGDMLLRVARTDDDPEIRSTAIFWLSQEAGEKAAEAIAAMAVDDPDYNVKEKAVFALSQLPPDVGVPRLIHVARTNSNPKVREQAIFWLGQSEDPRALDFFEEVLTH